MRYSYFTILCALAVFTGTLPAQQPSKTSKSKQVKSDGFISIYLNNTAILKLTKQEYAVFRDSINKQTKDQLHKVNDHKIEWLPANETKNKPAAEPAPLTYYSIYRDNMLLLKLEKLRFRKFKDSIATKTKDTLFMDAENRVSIHSYHPNYQVQKATDRFPGPVFINAKGYVALHLPLVKTHHYRISFFDADNKHLFDIKQIKETDLVLDKTNFIHAGWFSFELYEDDVLKEKNRLFLQKEQ